MRIYILSFVALGQKIIIAICFIICQIISISIKILSFALARSHNLCGLN